MPENLEYTATLTDNISPILDGLIAKFGALDSATTTAAASMVTALDSITASANAAAAAVSTLAAAAGSMAGAFAPATTAVIDNTTALVANTTALNDLFPRLGQVAMQLASLNTATQDNITATMSNTQATVDNSAALDLSKQATTLAAIAAAQLALDLTDNTAATVANTEATALNTTATEANTQATALAAIAAAQLSLDMQDAVAATEANTQATSLNTDALTNLDRTVVALQGAIATLTTAVADNTAALDANTAAAGRTAAGTKAVGDAAGGSNMNVILLAAGLGYAADKFLKVGEAGDDALRRVAGFTGASQSQMAMFTQALEQMAPLYGKTLADMANGLYDVYSAGFAGADALTVLGAGAKYASAAGLDMHDTLSSISGLLRTYYNLDASKAAMVTNDLAVAVRDGKVDAHEFGNALSVVSITAHDSGFSLQEAMSALSALTIGFKSPAQAGRDLNALLRDIGVSTSALETRANKLGITFNADVYNSTTSLIGKLQLLWDWSGHNEDKFKALEGTAYGWQAAVTLLNNNSETYNHTLSDMTQNTGALDNAFQIHQQGMSYAAQQLSGAFSVLAYQIEQFAQPAIVGAFGLLRDAFTFVSNAINSGSITMKIALGAVAGLLGGFFVAAVLIATSMLWGFISATVVALGPVLAIMIPIAALGAAFAVAYTQLQPFRDGVNSLASNVVSATQSFLGYTAALMGINNTPALPPPPASITNAAGTNQGGSTSQDVYKGRGPGTGDGPGGGQPGKYKDPKLAPIYNVTPSPPSQSYQNDIPNVDPILNNMGASFNYLAGFGDNITQITNPAKQLQVILQGLAQPVAYLAMQFGAFAKGVMTVVQPLVGILGPWFASFGAEIKSSFAPVWQSLVDTFQQQLIPAWNQLIAALKPLLPVFFALGALIGGIVVGAIGLLLGIIRGLVGLIAGVLPGIIRIFGGVVQVIAGVVALIVNFITGLVNLIIQGFKMITGQSNTFSKDWGVFWSTLLSNVVTIVKGLVNIVGGLFQGLIGGILGFVKGFVDGVVQFFGNLFNKLVGHSIIPDMILGIFQWFGKLPGMAIDQIGKFVSSILDGIGNLSDTVLHGISDMINKIADNFTGLPAQALRWMANFINSIADGIHAGIDKVKKAAGDVLNAIKSFFGFGSPTKEGPGTTADKWMPGLMNMYAQGMTDHIGNIKLAAGQVMLGIQTTLNKPLSPNLGLNPQALVSGSGNPLLPGASTGPVQVTSTINVTGGLGAGLQLMNVSDRAAFVKQISDEQAKAVYMQTRTRPGYSGGR